jgi:hypothetical protein
MDSSSFEVRDTARSYDVGLLCFPQIRAHAGDRADRTSYMRTQSVEGSERALLLPLLFPFPRGLHALLQAGPQQRATPAGGLA